MDNYNISNEGATREVRGSSKGARGEGEDVKGEKRSEGVPIIAGRPR